MLGEQYAELKGKITGQRVLESEGPTIETSVSVSGTHERNTSTQEMITFINFNLYILCFTIICRCQKGLSIICIFSKSLVNVFSNVTFCLFPL
jgi:hypothetical protein